MEEKINYGNKITNLLKIKNSLYNSKIPDFIILSFDLFDLYIKNKLEKINLKDKIESLKDNKTFIIRSSTNL